MEDLIKRKDAMDAVDRVNRAHMRLKGRPMVGWGTLLIEIESLPSAKPKTGRWILAGEQWQEDADNGNYCFICSECGKTDVHSKAVNVPYCWHCGARMKGGKE